MPLTRVTPKLLVSGQPSLAEIADLPAHGVAGLLNNRPDGEEPGQPGAAAERAAAEAAGLAYADLPVTGDTITRDDVRRFRETVAAAPGPVLAHCRGGTRSLTLHVLGEVLDGRMRREDVLAYGAGLGFDLTGALAWLRRHAPDRTGDAGTGDADTGETP
ncbi:TIGR01244 family sulfur transferase [Methylobacterium sp. Leaf108]|uniref:TIGR01244 family sulfur transferase n=1 Tax=Methylobacterium sp. Leaf108 TaxID=1736256 RepID=UPI0006F69F89|nr:TIGR01244 family sulfur transferase [Methylobacterium sp. Leaf108]KQP60616.1 phosphatase [Methylobacterium sp. Leaf108]